MGDSGDKQLIMADHEPKVGAFMDFIYNKETKEFFTRTPLSWAKILLFYLVYYSSLAVFFTVMLTIFLYTFTDDTAPVLTGNYSVLPPNPGMGYRPKPVVEKTLIKFKVGDEKTYTDLVKSFDHFLKPEKEEITYYKGQDDESKFKDCSANHTRPKNGATSRDIPCAFRLDNLEPQIDCLKTEAAYGFADGKPCVAVKMNKIFEFMPQLNKTGEHKDVDYLRIQCQGEHLGDMDNIGEIKYFPKDGFDLWYYPYLNQPNYINPLVFVQFLLPRRGVLIQVVCKPVNALNIVQDRFYRGDGRVHFELMLT